MKNLSAYADSSFDYYSGAKERKQSEDLKNRLIKIDLTLCADFDDYDKCFYARALNNLQIKSIYNSYKEDLLSLYSYKSFMIQKLKDRIISINPKTVSNTCQYCTINSFNSMDHVLPKSDFPQFSVHPKNLFPSCTECNSYMSKVYEQTGSKPFLNLYIDVLPDVQYLFVDVIADAFTGVNFNYNLINCDDLIDEEIFKQIESHYTRLNLFIRMKKASIEIIDELINDMKPIVRRYGYEIAKDMAIDGINENLIAYGKNHWRFICQKTLLNSQIFKNKCL